MAASPEVPMDTRVNAPGRPDVVAVSTDPPRSPGKASFSEVMQSNPGAIVAGAEGAMTSLPGSPLTALAVRGPLPAPPMPPSLPGLPAPPGLPGPMGLPGLAPPLPAGASAEGPGAATGPGAGAMIGSALMTGLPGALMGDGGLQASMIQSQQMNLYFLQIQQQVDAENRTFTTVSNVLKTENDTVKNAIGNMH